MIIGITGTLGAGKGTVVAYLQTLGWKHYSAGKFITDEVERRGMPVTRDSMSIVANDLRAAHGAGYLMAELVKKAVDNGADTIVEALHSLGEAEEVRKAGGVILAVDADVRVRYERICARKSAKDNVSFEKFLADNERESASEDPAQHNIARNMRAADHTIMNDGTLEELHAQIDAVLVQIRK